MPFVPVVRCRFCGKPILVLQTSLSDDGEDLKILCPFCIEKQALEMPEVKNTVLLDWNNKAYNQED